MKRYLVLKIVLIFIQFFATIATFANCNSEKFNTMPVLAEGRVRPFFVFAKETVGVLTNNKKEIKENAVFKICSIITGNVDKKFYSSFKIKIYEKSLKRILGLPLKLKSSTIGIDKLIENASKIQHLLNSKELDTIETNSLNRVLSIVMQINELSSGKGVKFYSENGWVNINELKKADLIENLLKGKVAYEKEHGIRHLVEYQFERFPPFTFAFVFVLITLLLLLLKKREFWILSAVYLALAFQFIGIILRGYIAERVPLSNMYETVMFSGFCSSVIGLIIYYRTKIYFALAGSFLFNLFTLFMIHFATHMLDSTINPLVPVLNNNYWLTIHVFTVMTGYAGFSISWILSNYVVIIGLKKEIAKDEFKTYDSIIMNCVRIGITFMTIGILTGGIWADYAWGRFWGWDPKEVWSLIVLLVYVIILHGRYTNWLDSIKFISLSAISFLTVLMAWFGVNYVLAAGLHSYGFSKGGTIFFMVVFFMQLTLSIFHVLKTGLWKSKNV